MLYACSTNFTRNPLEKVPAEMKTHLPAQVKMCLVSLFVFICHKDFCLVYIVFFTYITIHLYIAVSYRSLRKTQVLRANWLTMLQAAANPSRSLEGALYKFIE